MRVLQFFPLPESETEQVLLTTIVKSTIESSECALLSHRVCVRCYVGHNSWCQP